MGEVNILRIDKDEKKDIKDIVTQEIPLTIYINSKELLTLLCSPRDLKELSMGFLYSAGVIQSKDEIKSLVIDEKNWILHVELSNNSAIPELMFKRLYTSGCGRGTLFYNSLDFMHKKKIKNTLRISSKEIIKLASSFDKASVVFKETGGVHSAALSNRYNIRVFKEDIGRHNAVDKVIGEALAKDLDMKDLLLLTSGRITSEIIFKVCKIGSPIIVSRSAPTDQAIKSAEEIGITLIGFVRGRRMNVYTNRKRII